jgi:LytS/YehU family sensor histidine kinase
MLDQPSPTCREQCTNLSPKQQLQQGKNNGNRWGIGLQNIQKRLKLMYAGNYNLNTIQEEEMYAVKLTMQLSFPCAREASNENSFSHPLPAAAI